MRRYTICVNEEHYPEIARWLDEQKNVSNAVRTLINQHLTGDGQSTARLDLSAIRAVVEAALDEKMRSLMVAPVSEHDGADELDVFNELLA